MKRLIQERPTIPRSLETKQGVATLLFTAGCEVIDLGGSVDPRAAAVPIPSIGPSGYNIVLPAPWPVLAIDLLDQGKNHTEGLLSALRKGNTWVAVDSRSDLPMVGVLDMADDVDINFATFNRNVIWLTAKPRFIERPIKRPLILPPMARYFWGHMAAPDTNPLCGIASSAANLEPDASCFAFYVHLLYGKMDFPVEENYGQYFRFRNVYDLVHDNADTQNERRWVTGTIVIQPSKSYASAYATLTGAPTIAQWQIYGLYEGYELNSQVFNVGSFNPTPAQFTPRHKFRLAVNIQAAAGQDGQIDAHSVLEICTGGLNV